MHSLHHDNIVALHAIIFETGHYGIVMEYVNSGPLEDFTYHYEACCSVSASIASGCVCVFVVSG